MADRCPQWHAIIEGAHRSRHEQLAVDIALAGHDYGELFHCGRALGFAGLGLAQAFLHIDRHRHPITWFYVGNERLWQIYLVRHRVLRVVVYSA
ncbi:MAG: hypothetical protein HRT80_13535 [Henriciella sp.]|nr:hypothetical protein [Henriciella sp.]